jgi:uncharacterized protein YbjT (DUF2867 family)
MILVTGATGTVGSHVVSQLVAAGERPRAFVRDPDRAHQRFGTQVELVAGDLDRPETLAAGLAGVDRLFLITPQSTRQVDWEGAVIGLAAGAGVGHIVKVSVFRADEHSPLQIARQHWQAEQALERSGLAYTVVRPVFFMQNLLGMVRDHAIRTAAGDGRVAMVDARDVAATAVEALTCRGHDGGIYTLTGPEALRFDDVAETISQQTVGQIRHIRVQPDAVRTGLRSAGVEPWFVDDMAKLHGMLAAGYEDVLTEDVRTVTGSGPRPLSLFARDYSAAFTGLGG